MINKELRLTATIGNDGGVYIYDHTALSVFCRKHKGAKVIFKVKILGTGISEYMKGYFRNFILPEFRKAYMELGEYLTLEQTEEKIIELTPMLMEEEWSEEQQKYIQHHKKFEDLDNFSAVHCITHLKQIAALDFSFDIDDEQFST